MKGNLLYRDLIAASWGDFLGLFANRMLFENSNIWIDSKVKNTISMLTLGKEIWNSWNSINQFWKDSDKKHRIRTVVAVAINKESRVSEISQGKKLGE